MDNLERLKAIGIEEINSKTHISVTELMALFNKNYKAFNRAKLNGFIKIIEREFNIDLSDLLSDYGRYEQENGRDEQNPIVAAPKKTDEPKGRWTTIAIVILIVVVAAILYVNFSTQEAPPAPAPVVVPQLPPAETPPPVEQPQEEELATLPEDPQQECFVESDVDLWIGIFYIDDETRAQTTIRGRYDFVPDREQIITFGHGMFRLSCFDTVIEPANEAVQRVRIRNGEIVSSSQSQLRREAAPVERETE
ncbi:MAG: hypothetical protein LBT81_05730 [Helicobacteraceae bacterium]|jgi:cytoskeletal protein RodZ|nr:hypothetical protein [Helicobacteraceae bacterium]